MTTSANGTGLYTTGRAPQSVRQVPSSSWRTFREVTMRFPFKRGRFVLWVSQRLRKTSVWPKRIVSQIYIYRQTAVCVSYKLYI